LFFPYLFCSAANASFGGTIRDAVDSTATVDDAVFATTTVDVTVLEFSARRAPCSFYDVKDHPFGVLVT